MNSSKKVLVMGGTEFVSSSIAKHLIGKGYTVDVFSRGIKPIQYQGYRKHLKGDRTSLENLKECLDSEQYNYVFDISAYTREDVEKLLSVLNKESLKRYIFCSSGAVYQPTEHLTSEEFPKGENPNWGTYGLNKKIAEDYLMECYNNEGLPVTIFRPTYIYGEGNNLYRETHFFDRIVRDLGIPIPQSTHKNQFIYITDLAKLFESAMDNEKAVGQAYNATHPEEITWKSYVVNAMNAVGKEVLVKEIDRTKVDLLLGYYFPFRDLTYRLDIEKLKQHGLYVPQIDLTQGLQMAYKWYCEEKPNLWGTKMTKACEVLNY